MRVGLLIASLPLWMQTCESNKQHSPHQSCTAKLWLVVCQCLSLRGRALKLVDMGLDLCQRSFSKIALWMVGIWQATGKVERAQA